jgi:hypothetical protein
MSLIEDVEVAGGVEWDIDGRGGLGDAVGGGDDLGWVLGVFDETEEGDPNWGRARSRELKAGGIVGDGLGGAGLEGEEILLGGEEDGLDLPVGVKKVTLLEGMSGGEVGEWREGGEGVAGAEEEGTVGEGPEVAALIVEAPLGLGEDFAGGQLEQEGEDGSVVVVGGIVGEALEQAADAEGDEEVVFVDEVYGEE